MRDYFYLQYIMTNRRIQEIGIHPLLGYLLGFTAFILLSEYIFYKTTFAKYWIMLTGLGLQIQLSEKNRTDFLLATFGDENKRRIRVIENGILCLPFVALLLYKSFFVEACILLACSFVLGLFSFHSNVQLTIPTPFSQRPFEFSTGFRKTFFIFPIAYTLTLLAIQVDNLNLGIFAFLLIFVTTFSFFSKPEPEYYVWIYAMTPRAFLTYKVLDASKNAALLVHPILLSLMVFYPSDRTVILLFFVLGLLFLWTVILAKYSAYPNTMNVPEGMIIALSIWFPPLLLAMVPFFYRKSLNRLKSILHDHH
jgi:hypothetical protein